MATVLLSQRRILRSSLTGSVVTQRSNHSCVLPSLVNAPVLYNSSLSFSTTKKGPRNFTVQPQLSPSSSTSSTFSTFTSIRDAAARAVVSQAIDRIASDKPKVNESTNISDKDMEYDALTWKSIVDRPVLMDIDSISKEDLYPPIAPSLHDLVSSISSSSSVSTAPSSSSSSSSSSTTTKITSTHNTASLPTHSHNLEQLDLSAFPDAVTTDPFELVAADLRGINGNIKSILGIDHPVLSTVAKYFFDWEGGKKIRPALVLLMAHAVNAHMLSINNHNGLRQTYTTSGKLNLTPEQVQEANELSIMGVSSLLPEALRKPMSPQIALPLQRRLAEITEMIHTASLLHDDVIDAADTRRGISSVNTVFGNKLAVLAGDFLLARASVCLARLRNVPVVEVLSTVIEHLVKGEVMQMKTALRNEAASQAAFELYLRKTYYKTGSLMANSCKAIALLGNYPDNVCIAAYKYGMHLGIAFQLVDDMLDFEGTSASLGKPALNDITQGLVTAPVLFAAHRFPSLSPLIERKFSSPGDVEIALKAVNDINGIGLTRKLAVAHAQVAIDSIAGLESSPARTGLASLATKVLNRNR